LTAEFRGEFMQPWRRASDILRERMMKKLLLGALFALGALTLAAHARAGDHTGGLGPRGGLLAQVDADLGGHKTSSS